MFDSSQSGQQTSSAVLEDNQLRLRGKWLINSAKSLHSDLLQLEEQALRTGAPEAVDCTQVPSIDLAGIQLLLSLFKTLKTQTPLPILCDQSVSEWLALCDL